MKISKLEEGIIEMDVKTSKGSGGIDHKVTGKYLTGVARGFEAFCESMHQDHDDHDPFSPMENAAKSLASYAKQRGYDTAYNQHEKIEVTRMTDGVH